MLIESGDIYDSPLLKDEKKYYPNESPYNEPVLKNYPEIDKLIIGGKRVWLNSDWHLWEMNDTGEIVKSSNFEMIRKFHNAFVGPEDVFIFLGDFVDGEFDRAEELGEFIKSLNGIKILVPAGEDVFGDEFYLNAGFQYVLRGFKVGDLVFTHQPIDNYQGDGINIHGHLHGRPYDVTYGNHADIYTGENGFRPIELKQVIRKYENGDYIPKVRNDGPERAENVAESTVGAIPALDTGNPTVKNKSVYQLQVDSFNGDHGEFVSDRREETPAIINTVNADIGDLMREVGDSFHANRK